MTPLPYSLGHEAFQAALRAIINDRSRSRDEHRLAQLLLDVYLASADNPDVVRIINEFSAAVMNQGDAA